MKKFDITNLRVLDAVFLLAFALLAGTTLRLQGQVTQMREMPHGIPVFVPDTQTARRAMTHYREYQQRLGTLPGFKETK